jgi:hypothetical protein
MFMRCLWALVSLGVWPLWGWVLSLFWAWFVVPIFALRQMLLELIPTTKPATEEMA